MNKEELIEKIKQLADLTNEEKSELIGGLRKKKYGLVWENHPEEVEERLRTQLPVLVEDKSKQIASASEDAPNHILIEGDNFEALTALTYTHEGKVDVIYIDPPYNTGNKDFVYNDSFVDPEDGYRHSKWLSFMEKRLRIAKKLLSDRGVIFISIDDNEQANLKLLCDEVFGAHNVIAQMIWQQGKKHIGSFIGVNHEYMLVYAKSRELINDNTNKWKQRKEGLGKIYSEFNKLKKKYGADYRAIEVGMKEFFDSLPEADPAFGSKHYSRVDARGLFFADNISQGTGNGPRYDVLHPITKKPVTLPAGGWRYAYDTMQQLLAEDRIFFGDDETKVPCRKRYLKETEYELPSSVFYKDGRGATKEVETILGRNSAFNNPKDREVIARILNYRDNNIILDFFAGSGTTLHATMQLNKEDGGHRQCILVTNNENNICENVTYERNKRVINGYTTPKGEHVEGLHGNNLRYYKVDFVPREDTVANRLALMQKATDLLCIKHDLYDEQKQFGTLQLKSRYVRYFSNEEQQMLVVYEPRAIAAIVKELRQNPALATKERKLTVYAYSDGAYAYSDEFEGLEAVVGLVALPDALNQAIRNILPSPIADTTLFEEGDEA